MGFNMKICKNQLEIVKRGEFVKIVGNCGELGKIVGDCGEKGGGGEKICSDVGNL